jgi:hypothetical protein
MAFPLSPANNQTALVNGIVYQWNAALGVWKRNGSINSATIGQLVLTSAQASTSNVSGTLIVSGGAGITGNLYTGGIYITGANGITFPDGTVQTTAGVAVDSFARSTANSASSNTVVLQGVNDTQNTNITIANNAAQAAFAQANATAGGLTSANTRLTIIEGVDVGQNTRMSIIEGVDVSQNTRMSIIEGVDTTQNTNITIATNAATAAFAQANATAGGLTTANSRLTIIEGVNATQNSNITTANTPAGSDTQVQFNDGGIRAGSSSLTFNKTSGLLSSTLLRSTQSSGDEGGQLDLATAAANTSLSGGYVNIDIYQNKLRFFEAGGTNRGAFIDLSIAGTGVSSNLLSSGTGGSGIDQYARDTANLAIGIDATQNTNITIIQGVDTTQNTRLTIIEGVDVTQNTNITNADTKAQAAFDKANSAGAAANAGAVLTSTVDTFTGNGSNTAFTLSTTPATINYTTAVVGGVTQPRSAYSVVGTTLTFTSAPANGQTVEITTIGTSNTTLYTVNNIISPFLLMGA